MINYKISENGLNNIKNDLQYKEGIIKKITSHNDGWEVYTTYGGMDIPKENVGKFKPKVGMPIRFYGKGLGYTVRGVTIPTHDNTIVFYYRTPEEAEEDFNTWLEEENIKKQAKYEEEKLELDIKISKLPECFQKRIEKFRSNNKTFNRDFLYYEIYCINEALKIANTLKTVEAIDNFRQMDWGAQRKLVDIDEGHSGNTFSCSIMLAKTWLTIPADVVNVHGALCPLVGCRDYGCIER